jgi:26S proteasome regulatory subunit N6
MTDEDMAIDETPAAPEATYENGEEEEDISPLTQLVESAMQLAVGASQIPLLFQVIQDTVLTGSKALSLKERAVYDLTRAYCASAQYDAVVDFLTGASGQSFFGQITKAKTAKVVRQVLDIVCTAAAEEVTVQESIARSIIAWTKEEKRSFLRQRIEAKLAAILFKQQKYQESLSTCNQLLQELKQLDDKQLLVETHLLESKIHFALRNTPKAKAALTASRTAANAIYVSPSLQADIDRMSGTLHTEEGDYNTAHSYFLEAFEQLDQMNEPADAVVALKYMMLCKILDSLRAALKFSAAGGVGVNKKSSQKEADLSGILTGKQGVKYAGRSVQAMSAIGAAASNRDLKQFEETLHEYADELQGDLLIKHHLHVLQERLLESNLIRIVEPYSCVELDHVASLITLSVSVVERKLSQMILDGKLKGILDQGAGQLVLYESSEADRALEKSLEVIGNVDTAVTSLFARSKALRTMIA